MSSEWYYFQIDLGGWQSGDLHPGCLTMNFDEAKEVFNENPNQRIIHCYNLEEYFKIDRNNLYPLTVDEKWGEAP